MAALKRRALPKRFMAGPTPAGAIMTRASANGIAFGAPAAAITNLCSPLASARGRRRVFPDGFDCLTQESFSRGRVGADAACLGAWLHFFCLRQNGRDIPAQPSFEKRIQHVGPVELHQMAEAILKPGAQHHDLRAWRGKGGPSGLRAIGLRSAPARRADARCIAITGDGTDRRGPARGSGRRIAARSGTGAFPECFAPSGVPHTRTPVQKNP